MKIDVVYHGSDILGECPIWCSKSNSLYWIDSRAPALRRFVEADGSVESWALPEVVGSFCLRKAGGFLVALTTCLGFFEPASGQFTAVAALEPPEKGLRYNDGKCDRRGRFWVGSKPPTHTPDGTLFRFDPDATFASFDSGITIPNSLAFSPDDRTMYFADSYPGLIYAYDYDIESGRPRNKRVFARSTNKPDGATVDSEGCLWSADYDGWRIIRYAPDGRVDRIVSLPVQRPTSCAFGGSKLDRLYVTTANQKLSAAELAQQPLAGALLSIDVGVKGVPEPAFG
jgi:sugar lactone lactonase YvrE